MVRENYNFNNKISDYDKKLKEYFNIEYNEDEIETALNEIQNAMLFDEFIEDSIVELEEDYD